MANKALFSQLAVTILLLLIASKALANPTVIALTDFHIDCDSSPPVVGDMVWPMVETIPLGNPPDITTCSVTKLLPDGVEWEFQEHASVVVYPNAVGGVNCEPDSCHWAVRADGIYVHNPATDTEVLGYQWLI
ncbi:unnamed protein product [Calypogeia fissa]